MFAQDIIPDKVSESGAEEEWRCVPFCISIRVIDGDVNRQVHVIWRFPELLTVHVALSIVSALGARS